MRLTRKMLREMILQECQLLMEQQSGDKPSSSDVMASFISVIKGTGLTSGHQKTLVGMRSGQKVWVCPLSQLQPETLEYVGAQYEVFVTRKET